jgi:gliding motility-associated-like protein
MNVLADKQVFFPNAFTPNNNDFVNNEFGVFTNGLKYYSLEVYNRIGEKVFLSYNENKGWDGTYKGEDAPTGVYTYVAILTFLDGENRKYKGTVTLLR